MSAEGSIAIHKSCSLVGHPPLEYIDELETIERVPTK